MAHTIESTIQTVRELGFVCRWNSDCREFRLARRLSDYRNMSTQHQRAQQELQAYYCKDSDDCIDTAVAWATQLGWQTAAA